MIRWTTLVPERGSPTGLSVSGQQSYEGGSCRQSLQFGKFPRSPIVLKMWAGDKVQISKGKKWSNGFVDIGVKNLGFMLNFVTLYV